MSVLPRFIRLAWWPVTNPLLPSSFSSFLFQLPLPISTFPFQKPICKTVRLQMSIGGGSCFPVFAFPFSGEPLAYSAAHSINITKQVPVWRAMYIRVHTYKMCFFFRFCHKIVTKLGSIPTTTTFILLSCSIATRRKKQIFLYFRTTHIFGWQTKRRERYSLEVFS